MNQPHSFYKRTVPLAAAAAFVLAGVVGVSHAALHDKAPATASSAGIPISVASVIERSITETQEFSGRMEAIEHVEIHARVGGFITQVNIRPGALVRKGDVLFVVDPRPYQAAADQAEAEAAAARAKVDLARIELSRSQKLLAEKAIAQRELDASESDFKALDAGARAAEAKLATARLNLDYTRVTAPIDGRVGKAEITVGNLVDASALLTSVVSDDKIYASFTGDEDTFLRVGAAARRGEKVSVNVGLANEDGFPHEGQLEFVDNQLDPQTGAVRMRAVFANEDKKLVPGLFARVQLQGGNGTSEKSRVLMISERAIGTDQSRKFVYVVNADNKAEYRPVTLGQSVDGLRVVKDGLKAGDRIVVNGLQRVSQDAQLAPHVVEMDFDSATASATSKPAKAATPTTDKG